MGALDCKTTVSGFVSPGARSQLSCSNDKLARVHKGVLGNVSSSSRNSWTITGTGISEVILEPPAISRFWQVQSFQIDPLPTEEGVRVAAHSPLCFNTASNDLRNICSCASDRNLNDTRDLIASLPQAPATSSRSV